MNAADAPLAAEVSAIRAQAGPGKRIAFVSGNFNVVHPGHLRLLKFAREQADFLVVGVTQDGSPGVSLPLDMRLEGVAALSYVDRAVALRSAPVDFIAALQPHFVVKGKEYEDVVNAEEATVAAYGGRLLFGSGEVRFASLSLLRGEYFDKNYTTISKPRDFPKRHGFGMESLTSVLKKFTKLRVLVVGDLIVDEYINCDPLGMSQEDPTLVVTPIEAMKFVGGAGIVAAHARGLGAQVRFVSLAGADLESKFAHGKLREYGVEAELFIDDARPTTLKQRFRASGKTLLRVNSLRQHAPPREISRRMLDAFEAALKETDLVLFADFNYGCLPQTFVDAACSLASARNAMMAADSQASSQLSDISRFKDMTLVTPTEREARLALHDFDSGLAVVAENLRAKARAENLVITLGGEGLLVRATEHGEDRMDQLPAFNRAPKDVAGASDSFFTCASLALAAGIDIWRSAYLGSIASACQTARVGNTPLTSTDIQGEIDAID
jgi:rfaE bifunctional protein kinase chain/domain